MQYVAAKNVKISIPASFVRCERNISLLAMGILTIYDSTEDVADVEGSLQWYVDGGFG